VPIIDRFEKWKTWVSSPADLASVVERARDEVAENLRARAIADRVAAFAVSMDFSNRTISHASLDDFTSLRGPDLRDLQRVELRAGTIAANSDDLEPPKVTLTLRNAPRQPALTLSVVGPDLTFVEGLTATLKGELANVEHRRGRLLSLTVAAAFLSTVLLGASLGAWNAARVGKPALAGAIAGASIGTVVGFFVVGMTLMLLDQWFPRLELVPAGMQDRYTRSKSTMVTALGLVGVAWTVLGLGTFKDAVRAFTTFKDAPPSVSASSEKATPPDEGKAESQQHSQP
jgi:hypothetical protein